MPEEDEQVCSKPPAAARRGKQAVPAATEPDASMADDPSSQPAACSAAADATSGDMGTAAAPPAAPLPPVLLVLEAQLHALPWESTVSLKHLDMYRVPSLAVAAATAAMLRDKQQAAGAPGSTSSQSAVASAVAPTEKLVRGRGKKAAVPVAPPTAPAAEPLAGTDGARPGGGDGGVTAQVDLSNTFYMLNPGGDLMDTQQCFEDWFASQLNWQVGLCCCPCNTLTYKMHTNNGLCIAARCASPRHRCVHATVHSMPVAILMLGPADILCYTTHMVPGCVWQPGGSEGAAVSAERPQHVCLLWPRQW